MKKIILIIILISFGILCHAQRDVKFAVDAANANLLEVKLGELAITSGYSDAVKQLGQSMKDDHSKANIDLMDITTKKGIAVPTDLNEKGQQKYDRLAKKNAEDFDKAYTKCMVKSHKKNICKFKKEARKGKDPDLKQFASSTVPTLQNHLEMARNACDQVKKKK